MHSGTDHITATGAPAPQPLAFDTALARKIAIVLAMKVCFLVAIKQLWFSTPQAVDMTMPTDAVEQRLLGPAPQRQ
jgi:hypothetical protein